MTMNLSSCKTNTKQGYLKMNQILNLHFLSRPEMQTLMVLIHIILTTSSPKNNDVILILCIFQGTRNSEIRYSIIGWSEMRHNFTIDPISGELKPVKPLDFEAIPKDSRHQYSSSFPITIQV